MMSNSSKSYTYSQGILDDTEEEHDKHHVEDRWEGAHEEFDDEAQVAKTSDQAQRAQHQVPRRPRGSQRC